MFKIKNPVLRGLAGVGVTLLGFVVLVGIGTGIWKVIQILANHLLPNPETRVAIALLLGILYLIMLLLILIGVPVGNLLFGGQGEKRRLEMGILDRIFGRGKTEEKKEEAFKCYVCGKDTQYHCSVCNRYICPAHTAPGTTVCKKCQAKRTPLA